MFSEPKGLLEADADTAFFNPTWSLSRTASRATTSTQNDDLVLSRQFGIQNEFIRQFGPLSTFSCVWAIRAAAGGSWADCRACCPARTSFAMSIISVSSCVASTLDQALLTGGPSSVVYCWLGGSIFSMCVVAPCRPRRAERPRADLLLRLRSTSPCPAGRWQSRAFASCPLRRFSLLLARTHPLIIDWLAPASRSSSRPTRPAAACTPRLPGSCPSATAPSRVGSVQPLRCAVAASDPRADLCLRRSDRWSAG